MLLLSENIFSFTTSKVLNDVASAVDNKQNCVAFFIDLSFILFIFLALSFWYCWSFFLLLLKYLESTGFDKLKEYPIPQLHWKNMKRQ